MDEKGYVYYSGKSAEKYRKFRDFDAHVKQYGFHIPDVELPEKDFGEFNDQSQQMPNAA